MLYNVFVHTLHPYSMHVCTVEGANLAKAIYWLLVISELQSGLGEDI